MSDPGAPVLLFVVTEDWYFVTHRLPLARAARDAGYRVIIAARFGDHEALLRKEGFQLEPIRLRRRARSPLHELGALLELRRLYRRLRPTVVHHVALKPVVFGSLAALGLRPLGVVNAVAGLGYTFSSTRLRARLIRLAMIPALRFLLRRPASVVIVQNDVDRETLERNGIADAADVLLIRGAGVDLADFTARPEGTGTPIVLFAGRLLWEKGVGDFVEAARALRGAGVDASFVLAGEPDEDNPGSLTAKQVAAWVAEGVVEHWGRRSDMPVVMAESSIVCLPSRYGEGVPKVLLEAAASGRAVVTTDWPGCRDAVRPGETGLLVPPGDVDALTSALRGLIDDPERRRSFGSAARRLAEREFDVRAVAARTLESYRRVAAP